LPMLEETVHSAKVYGSISGQPEVVKFLKEGMHHD